MSIRARYQRAEKPSIKLTFLEESLPELSVWRWVKGWVKATTRLSVLSPLVLMIRKKRGERDPALKITDNGGGHQLGLHSINWCLCVGHWPSKSKSKFLMPATVVFSGHTVNTGSAFKALSALTVNFLITLTIKILVKWNVSMFSYPPEGEILPTKIEQHWTRWFSLIGSIVFDNQILKFDWLNSPKSSSSIIFNYWTNQTTIRPTGFD